MPIRTEELPHKTCLVRLKHAGQAAIAVWSEGQLSQTRMGLDALMRLSRVDMRDELAHITNRLDPSQCELVAPVESQEVWAAGVTYLRSRAARMTCCFRTSIPGRSQMHVLSGS